MDIPNVLSDLALTEQGSKYLLEILIPFQNV